MRRLLLILLLVTLAAPALAADKPDPRPNILFCIADDWGWPNAGVYGDPVCKTPAFDGIAKNGVLFNNVFVPAPSCTPCRGGILTGQAAHRLEEGGNLWSWLNPKFPVYTDILEKAGYFVGQERKGWGPGSTKGWKHNPAGKTFKNFEQFLAAVPKDKPFCFWAGTSDPHRGYAYGSGVKSGMDLDKVKVPGWLPDTKEIRNDLCDYYFEVQRFDRDIGQRLEQLKKAGRWENTLVLMTGDHGMPFPRAKCNLYDSGTHVPLAAQWPAKIKPGRVVDDFISFCDFAPTFLEAAGIKPPKDMTGRSFTNLLTSDKSGWIDPVRDKVFVERERHTVCRPNGQSYPVRGIRTKDFFYLRNLRPNLWPIGDPDVFRDCDGSPSKTEILKRRAEPEIAPFFDLSFAKRPEEELFDLKKDPDQIRNVAAEAKYADVKKKLRAELDKWMAETADPRAKGETDFFDTAPYQGRRPPQKKPAKKGDKK